MCDWPSLIGGSLNRARGWASRGLAGIMMEGGDPGVQNVSPAGEGRDLRLGSTSDWRECGHSAAEAEPEF